MPMAMNAPDSRLAHDMFRHYLWLAEGRACPVRMRSRGRWVRVFVKFDGSWVRLKEELIKVYI